MISPGILMARVIWLTLLQCQAVQSPKEMVLYADQKWYLEAPALVAEYQGRLFLSEPMPGPGDRVHHARLEMKDDMFWIYDPERKLMKISSDKTVRIEGKMVTDSLSGIINELWPGRMWVE